MFSLAILVALTFLCAYFFSTRNLEHWKRQNVPFAPNALPIFGHILSLFTLRDNYGTFVQKIYRKMDKRSMYGCYVMQTPALLIRDSKLIERILGMDFSSSLSVLKEKLDPILTKNAFFARGEVWRTSRSLLARYMTERKLRSLLVLVNEVCEDFIRYVDAKAQRDFELRDLFTRVVGELVARSTFGIEGHCFEDRSFVRVAERLFQPSTPRVLIHNVRLFLPRLADFLGISFMPKDMNTYIRHHLVDKVDTELAQATSMFFDGYEPLSSALSFAAYQVAGNARVQEKARLEVRRTLEKHQGYEALGYMRYLDQIFYETLRMYPAFGEMSRVCDREMTLRGYDGLECKLRPGDIVLVPVSGIHNDEEFWPNPGTFNPERFEKADGLPFFGFGSGARACPGRRMAILVARAVLASVLANYSLERMTTGPLKLNTGAFVSTVDGGLWVHFKPLDVCG